MMTNKAFKICQHSVAVAESCGSLAQFLKWRKSLSKTQNSVETLSRSSLPMATTGKKKNDRRGLPKKKTNTTTTLNFVDPLDHKLTVSERPLSSSVSSSDVAQMPNVVGVNPEIKISSGAIQNIVQVQVMCIISRGIHE